MKSLNLLRKTCLMMIGAASLADYVVENFAAEDNDFSPTLWAHASYLLFVTTNGAESYHRVDI